LLLTFPQSLEQLPAFDNYSMAGHTYRYMTAEPVTEAGGRSERNVNSDILWWRLD
jgi:hypothetical protein